MIISAVLYSISFVTFIYVDRELIGWKKRAREKADVKIVNTDIPWDRKRNRIHRKRLMARRL